MEVKWPQSGKYFRLMEVNEPQSETIQIKGSDGASSRYIIQINGSDGASNRDII